jgi:RNA polymerase sigma-70 factor (ECF subfamily)
MQKHSDEQLMLAFSQSDFSPAFEELYARHKDAIYRYYLRNISNEAISQELYQDLWLKVIKNKHKYQVKAKFTTWLYTLAHNRLVDWYRRNTLEKKAFVDNIKDIDEETQELGQIDWNPEDELQSKRLAKQLKQAIAELPTDQREVFILHQESALTLPQIAEMLQTGLEKIKSRYRYSIKKLRNALEKGV